MTNPTSAQSALLALFCTLLATACGSAIEGAERPTSSAAPRCAEGEPAPPLAAPPPVGTIASRITLEVQAQATWLERSIGARVPVELARGRQGIGLPGRIEYSLRRGELSVSLEQDSVVVGAAVEGQVTLCKPIAGFCPVYGRCSPRLSATVSVPLLLTKDYEIEGCAVSIPLTHGCQIAVFDATGEVASRAQAQARTLKRDIDRSLPRLHPLVEQGWHALQARVELGPIGCLITEPHALSQSKPRLESGVLSTSFTVEGTLALERECPKAPASTLDLPQLTYGSAPEPTVVELPLAMPWSVVARELGASLSARPQGSSIKQVRAHGALVLGQPRLVLELHVTGACGALWLAATPWLEPETNRVRLRDVALLSQTRAPISPAKLARVMSEVTSFAAISLLIDPRRASTMLEETLHRELDKAANIPLWFDVSIEPTPGRVLLDGAKLVPIIGIGGRAIVRPKED